MTHVYVLTTGAYGGQIVLSVHATKEGAQKALEEFEATPQPGIWGLLPAARWAVWEVQP